MMAPHLASTRMHSNLRQMFNGWARIFSGTARRRPVADPLGDVVRADGRLLAVTRRRAMRCITMDWKWLLAVAAHFVVMTAYKMVHLPLERQPAALRAAGAALERHDAGDPGIFAAKVSDRDDHVAGYGLLLPRSIRSHKQPRRDAPRPGAHGTLIRGTGHFKNSSTTGTATFVGSCFGRFSVSVFVSRPICFACQSSICMPTSLASFRSCATRRARPGRPSVSACTAMRKGERTTAWSWGYTSAGSPAGR